MKLVQTEEKKEYQSYQEENSFDSKEGNKIIVNLKFEVGKRPINTHFFRFKMNQKGEY